MLIVWCTCIVRTTFSNSSFEEVDVGVEGVRWMPMMMIEVNL